MNIWVSLLAHSLVSVDWRLWGSGHFYVMPALLHMSICQPWGYLCQVQGYLRQVDCAVLSPCWCVGDFCWHRGERDMVECFLYPTSQLDGAILYLPWNHIMTVTPSLSSMSSRKCQLAPIVQVVGCICILVGIRYFSFDFLVSMPALCERLCNNCPSSGRILSCRDCSELLLAYHNACECT